MNRRSDISGKPNMNCTNYKVCYRREMNQIQVIQAIYLPKPDAARSLAAKSGSVWRRSAVCSALAT